MALKVVLTGISGVFIGLIILCISLFIIQKLVSYFSEKKINPKRKTESTTSTASLKKHKTISGEAIAAIAATIYLDLQSFDEKKKLLTIQQVTKPYAPWVNSGKAMLISDHNNLYRNR